MRASPVLVDSSWYIRRIREKRNAMRELMQIGLSRDLATCGIVRCEVARGIRDPAVLQKYRDRWDVMLDVPMNNTLWLKAENLLGRLDRAGIILPLSDVLIAACALHIGAVVLTCDAHFHRIPGLRWADRIV